MCVVEYACTIYRNNLVFLIISLRTVMCTISQHWAHSLNINPSPWAPIPFYVKFTYWQWKINLPLCQFVFNLLGRFRYIYMNKIYNSCHVVIFWIYISSKFNMSKLCNYIILHVYSKTHQTTCPYDSISTICVRTPEVVSDGLAVIHDVH